MRGSFNRVRFAHNGGPGFYTTVNCAGVGHILYWEQDSVGEIVLRGRLKAHTTAITAFDVSLSGRFIGTGTSEGAPTRPNKCHDYIISYILIYVELS